MTSKRDIKYKNSHKTNIYRDYYIDKKKSNVMKNTDILNEMWKNKRSIPMVSNVTNNLPMINNQNINDDLNEVHSSRVYEKCEKNQLIDEQQGLSPAES